MGQETRGDVRDLPQDAIDATSFLNVIFVLILVMPENRPALLRVQCASKLVPHRSPWRPGCSRVASLNANSSFLSARYVSEICACKNNLYTPKHVHLNFRFTFHNQQDFVRFRVDVDLSSRSDFSDLRFCATS